MEGGEAAGGVEGWEGIAGAGELAGGGGSEMDGGGGHREDPQHRPSGARWFGGARRGLGRGLLC